MIRSASETFPAFRTTRLLNTFNAILTQVDATMGLISAAHKAASISEMHESINIQRLKRLGLFGRSDSNV